MISSKNDFNVLIYKKSILFHSVPKNGMDIISFLILTTSPLLSVSTLTLSQIPLTLFQYVYQKKTVRLVVTK